MGFTIEDMLVVSQDRYKMKMIAGNGGWSNSISWLMMLEDLTIIIYTQLLRTDREHRVLCNGNPAVSEGLLRQK